MSASMSISLLLSSWLMLPLSITELSDFKRLTVNNPKQALVEFPALLTRHQDGSKKQIALLYYQALTAASRADNWPMFISLLRQMESPDLKEYIEEIKVRLLSTIGVSYRVNGQLEQAGKHYQCAFEFVSSDIELAQLKVNQAIVYRMLDQPAIAFQLIDSLESRQLSDKVKAGYYVVKGNIEQSLGRFDNALQHYIQAHKLYIKRDDRRSQAGVTGNILGAALAAKKFDLYLQYRHNFEDKVRSYYPQALEYIQWLDIVEQSLQLNRLTSAQRQWLKKHVVHFIAQGYEDVVKAHLTQLNAMDIYPKAEVKQFESFELPLALGKPWCTSL